MYIQFECFYPFVASLPCHHHKPLRLNYASKIPARWIFKKKTKKKTSRVVSSVAHFWSTCNLLLTTTEQRSINTLNLLFDTGELTVCAQKSFSPATCWLTGSNECTHWKAVTFARGHATPPAPAKFTLPPIPAPRYKHRGASTRNPNMPSHT